MDTSLQCFLFLAIVLLLAKAMGHVGARVGLPLVLGELAAGIVLGPSVLNLWHLSWFSPQDAGSPSVPAVFQVLAQLGMVVLMFLAGLETDVKLLRSSLAPAFWAAAGGVVLPMVGGMLVSRMAGLAWAEAIFIGTILTATSVTITAQTLINLGRLRSRTGSTILGAAVIDDVLGLIVLSIVIAIEAPAGRLSTASAGAAFPIARMLLFLVLAFALGPRVMRAVLTRAEGSTADTCSAAAALAVSFLFAFFAVYLGGMAAITGSFLAGAFAAAAPARQRIIGAVRAICNDFLGPIFFVSIGLQIDAWDVGGRIRLFLALFLVAVLGKVLGCAAGTLAAGIGAREAFSVGVGMIPRGEVGLMTASIGFAAGLISHGLYVQVVILVLATSLVTPALLPFFFPRSSAGDDVALAAVPVESVTPREIVSPL